jgi:hypothetical protein
MGDAGILLEKNMNKAKLCYVNFIQVVLPNMIGSIEE